MNELTTEWVAKAEGDFATAGREMRVRRSPNYDAVCFHAQQTVEKYLKALLQEHGADFPKMHSLIELLELGLILDASLEFHRDLLVRLDRYAVRFRYPGEVAEKAEARAALEAAGVVRVSIRGKLGLPSE
jgi:HEPN domain-containing protein